MAERERQRMSRLPLGPPLNFLVESESRSLRWGRLELPYELKVGEEHLKVVHHRPGFCLLDDGRCLRYTSVFSFGQQEWTLQWQGQTFTVKALRSVRDSAGSIHNGLVKSPMNGVVVKMGAAIGDQVEAGQVILVLEAMKMENEVSSPLTGKLIRCEVCAGQVVGAHQVLFEVEAEA